MSISISNKDTLLLRASVLQNLCGGKPGGGCTQGSLYTVGVATTRVKELQSLTPAEHCELASSPRPSRESSSDAVLRPNCLGTSRTSQL
jgi:hypothetical protein